MVFSSSIQACFTSNIFTICIKFFFSGLKIKVVVNTPMVLISAASILSLNFTVILPGAKPAMGLFSSTGLVSYSIMPSLIYFGLAYLQEDAKNTTRITQKQKTFFTCLFYKARKLV